MCILHANETEPDDEDAPPRVMAVTPLDQARKPRRLMLMTAHGRGGSPPRRFARRWRFGDQVAARQSRMTTEPCSLTKSVGR